jgi:hypothetical protein
VSTPFVGTSPWPFDGRVFRALGDELLPHPWLCQRAPDSLNFVPVRPGIEQLLVRPPNAALELMTEYQVRSGLTVSQRVLGLGTPACLSSRPGLLLSDALLMETPVARELLAGGALLEARLGADWLRWLYALLSERLHRLEITLSGLPWPLAIETDPVAITAETLPGWELDLATDFARRFGTETYLCDLRVEPVVAETQQLPDLEGLSDTAARIAIYVTVLRQNPKLGRHKQAEKIALELFGDQIKGRSAVLKEATESQHRYAFKEARKRLR